MYQHILIATDGSVLANQALEHGVELAKAVGARVSVVTVIPPISAYGCRSDFEAVALDCARKIEIAADDVLANAEALIKSNGLEGQTVKARDSEPSHAILKMARERGADLIVTAPHSRPRIPTATLGGEMINVLSHSNIPVLVYRERRGVAAQANSIA
ncbi:MAG: universal stress protein [Alphaproteobacteria bacterium]